LKKRTAQLNKQKKQLEESEFRWKFAVDGRGDGLWDWNVDTNEVYFSKAWKEMLGFKEDEIQGSLEEWKKRVHPDDLEKVYEDINSHMNGETEVYSNEHRVMCKDGSYKWVHDRGIVVQRNEKGRPTRLIGTHTDITLRKETEFKMQQALIVYENTNEGIMITNSKNEIIDVNHSFCKTTGYSYEEVIGKNPSILKSNIKESDFYRQMWQELKDNGSWHGEITNKKKNGELYEEYLNINTIKNNDGTVINYIGIFSDVSVLKQQEKMILQQARTSAIGEMIGNIAHQWRQPLSAISTASTGLKVQLEMDMEISKEETIESLEKINSQTQFLSRTIEDFRGFFSEDMSEVFEFEITEAINKVNDLTKDSFKINFVQVYYDIEKEVFILANKNLLIQALINIYNNALDVLKEIEGKRLLFISVKKNDFNTTLSIKDNGGGISSSNIEKIFDPYFTTKHQSQGTGIGLYMSHQIIVKQLKGNILAKNVKYEHDGEEFMGALFTIIIPTK
jgi:PAS domain S-box-containing protein